MTDYDAYKLYCALKRHFQTTTYDYFKYSGKVKVSYAAFERRNDKYFFAKLAKHKDVMGFLVANFYYGDVWVGDLVNEQIAEKQYREWLRRKESLSYIFKSELDSIDDLRVAMKVSDKQHPVLLKRFMSKDMSAETLIILDAVQNNCLFRYWDSKLSDPVWDSEYNKLLKLTPFISFDVDKYKHIVTDR